MFCEGTVIGLNLPEDGVNETRKAKEQELICYFGNMEQCTKVGR